MAGNRHRVVRAHGQVRRSQMVGAYGPGAMVDLPNHAVIIGGLESWGDPDKGGFQAVHEERLRTKLATALEIPTLRFFAPPIEMEKFTEHPVGVTAWQFPEWFIAQYERKDSTRARPIVHQRKLVGGKFFTPDRAKRPVIPIRFVQACVLGHISDIDWVPFAHRGQGGCQQQLWLLERGTSGDFLDIFVECDCKKFPPRSLFEATRSGEDGNPTLGFCRGQRPWLGRAAGEKCEGESGKALPNRLLVRSASNAYFAQVVSAISIPERDAALQKAVAALWDDFQVAEGVEDIKRERRKARVQATLGGRKGPIVASSKGIKQAEVETLLASQDEVGEDAPQSDFYARRLPLPGGGAGVLKSVERVVLVHRLREVIAQVGFTRFEPATPDIEGELDLGVRPGALARELTWLPAVENHGEGIFIALKSSSIKAWQERPEVKARGLALAAGFSAWASQQKKDQSTFVGLPYVFLHSLSHLLITAVSLECGYSASSIRERIYATDSGYGILLHTGTADAEGTLGGLVAVGRRIESVLRQALELGRLCSNDPVCAQHAPNHPHEERFLQGAACHGCLLISESSCERRNEYLDRALVVPTVEDVGAEFFTEEA
jgi:hypothetical protein